MVRRIRLLGDPTLRTKCASVKKFDPKNLQSLISDMRDTLYDFRSRNGFGRGIAAPQIGSTLRVIFTHVDEPIVLINPRIVKRSKRMFSLWDDCFSFPDLLVKVKRHFSVEVHYHIESGEKRTMRASGAMSELLQHEIDHLDGVLAIDRAIDFKHIIYRSERDNFRTWK